MAEAHVEAPAVVGIADAGTAGIRGAEEVGRVGLGLVLVGVARKHAGDVAEVVVDTKGVLVRLSGG